MGSRVQKFLHVLVGWKSSKIATLQEPVQDRQKMFPPFYKQLCQTGLLTMHTVPVTLCTPPSFSPEDQNAMVEESLLW